MRNSNCLVLLLAILSVSMAARIYPWGEPYIRWPNSGHVREMQLFFSLETKLPKGHYLRLQLPFTTQPSISVTAYQQTASRGTVSQPSTGLITATQVSAQSTAPFNMYYRFSDDLNAGLPYVLRITFGTQPADAGWLGYVQMETMSPADSIISGTDTPITYDLNNAFAPIHILPAPGAPTVSWGAVEPTATPTVAATQYVQPIQIVLSQDFWYQPTILITWNNAAFSIADGCKSADTGVSSTVVTPATDYTCSTDQTNLRIKINHNARILRNETVTYNLTITTPAAGGSATFSVYVYHRWNMNLTDILESGPTLTVTAPSGGGGGSGSTTPALSAVRALLSWGIDPKNELNSVTNSFIAISAGEYQSIRFAFDLNTALSSGTYTVKVQLCATAANCDALENSIYHSFGASATCNVVSGTDVSVTCSVSSIQQTNNFVAVKVKYLTTVVTTNAITESGFGQITITSSATGFSTINAIALDSAYKKAYAPTKTLTSPTQNGPIIGLTDTTAWGYITDATNGVTDLTDGTAGAVNYLDLMGGIFASPSTDATMNVALLTLISQGLDVSGGSDKTVWGLDSSSADKGHPAKAGIDLIMNPNLWTAVSSVPKGTCWAAGAGKKPATSGNAVIAPGATTYDAHCFARTNGTPAWTRLRFISITAVATAHATASYDDTLTFFWPGFVKQTSRYVGASLKADNLVGDYYVAYYTTTATVASTDLAATGDLGELGGATLSNTAVTITANDFFTQYHMSPVSVQNSAPTVSTNYAGLEVFISGTKGAGLTADQSISLLRARGTLASGTDAYPSSAQLILFFAPVATNAYTYLAPAGSTTGSTSIRCFTSASGVCNLDRPQRTGSTGVLNAIDYYQVVSTIASFSTSATSLAIALATNSAYAAEDYRVGWLGSTTGMAWIAGKAKAVTVTTTATENTAGGSTTCASDWGSSTGSPVPPVRPVMDRSSTSYYVNNQISSIAFKYRITDDTNYVAPSAGYGGFTWCAQWDFRGSSTVSFSNVNNLEKNADKCVAFDYQSSTPTKWYCIYCPVTATSTALTESDASFSINNFKASPATDINSPTYSVVYNDAGELLDRTYCDRTLDAWIPGSASASTTGSAFAQVAQKVTVTFSLGSTGKDASTVVLQGRQSGTPTSVDTTFPQSTFESNAECWIAPSASVTLADFKKLGSCPTTGSGVLTFTLPAGFDDIKSQSGFKLVLWGLTGNAAPSPAPTSQYFILYSNDGSGSEIDMTKESPSVLGDLVSWPVLSTINNFTVTAPQYTRPLLGSRGTFRWDFTLPSVRPWYYLDNIVFSLDAISTAAENANAGIIQCRITDSTGAVNQNFKSCTFSSSSSPATLTIVSLGSGFLLEFAATGIRVNLDGVKALVSQVSSKTIYGRHYFGTSSNSVALTKDNTATDLIAPSDVSSKAFPSNYPVITKHWGNAQGVMDVAFSLISSATVTEQFRITIEFPTYYNPGLTTRSIAPVCSVDGVNTNCQVIRPRTLQIDGFANSKNANVQFIVRVSGIAAPVISTADSFWIQINSDRSESASTVIYAGSLIEPVVALQTIVPLHVNWFTPASGSTRSITTLTWTFNPLGTEDHGTTRAVQAVFPPHWGLSTGRFTPTCNVQDWANPSTVYTSTQSAIVSNTITMNIAQTLIRNRIVNLVCQNVRVAENDGTYPSQDVQIRIVDQNGTAVYQASAPSVHNVNFAAQWAISSSLNYINWGDATTTWYATPIVYVLPRGTYSLFRSVSIVGRSARTLQLSVSPAQFTFQTSPYNVTTGDDDLGNFIGTAGSTPINTYSLLFSLNDGTYFVAAPSIWVQVTMDKTDLIVTPLGDVPIIFSSGVTSKSNPVVFTAYFNAPYSDVTITPSVDSIYSANFTVTPTSITLTPSFAFGTFVYTTTGSTQSGETNVFKYALSGTNANSYNTPAIHNVKAVADSNVEIGVTPVLAINADGTDQGRATYKVLNFALSGVSTATVYFGCQVAGTWSYDADGIYTAALTWYNYDHADPFHGYYDILVMTKASDSYTVTGLAPNSNYECRGFAISNGFKNSTVASHAFRTASNGAQINRWLFNTSTYPTAAQRQALLCTLTQTLRVPPQNVIAVSGEICGNSTTFYNTANTSMIAIYFYPLNVESDAIMTTTALQTALNGTSTFSLLNRTVVANGGPAIFNIFADGTPQKNQVTLNVPSTVQADLSWLALSGVTLNETGYVVAALASQGSSAPTPLQLKQAATQSSSLQVQSGYYDANLGSLSFNFSGLDEDTQYDIYVVGTNNDPSWFQNSTAVNALQGTTTKSPTNGVTLFCSVVMAFVAVISLIFV